MRVPASSAERRPQYTLHSRTIPRSIYIVEKSLIHRRVILPAQAAGLETGDDTDTIHRARQAVYRIVLWFG